MDVHVGARPQLAVGVVHRQFRDDRARGRDDGIGRGQNLRRDRLVRVLRQRQRRGQARLQDVGIFLRHRHEDPHRVDVRDDEQRRRGTAKRRIAAGGIDVVTDIGVPGGHHAVERRNQLLERDQRLVARDILLGGGHLRLLRGGVRRLHVDILLRHRLRPRQRRPAFGGDLGQLVTGLHHGEVRLGRRELGIQAGVSMVARTSPAFTCAP